MKYKVKRLRSLSIALKELEPHIRHGRSLQVHREFKSIKQRPRELLANWLLCAVGCAERGKETLIISEDPLGGDGLIIDIETDEKMFSEHVYVPPQDALDLGVAIIRALEHKVMKGEQYAKGRTLVIFSGARGTWWPNKVARQTAGTHKFNGVWVINLDADAMAQGRYAYMVTELNVSLGNAPISRVTLSEDFSTWEVEREQ